MDKIVEKIVGLGIPGLILLVAINVSGYAGAAAITSSLAILGGPAGMLGGIGILGFSVYVSMAISKYSFDRIYTKTIEGLKEKGETKESINIKIDKYPISRSLKLKLKDLLENTHG
ncbi:hypothetical protein [Winogradskyella sp.]|uniref:hypothetical protein n=1 Tax=Winogradskyella sp. TaxID=1883156 RepID=UPI003AB7A162